MIDGLSTANAELAGQASNFLPNMGAARGSGGRFLVGDGGPGDRRRRINIIPREGGNAINGSVFATAANSAWQTSNYTQDLIDRGLITPNALKFASDVNPGLGGPMRPDKLWFFLVGRGGFIPRTSSGTASTTPTRTPCPCIRRRVCS